MTEYERLIGEALVALLRSQCDPLVSTQPLFFAEDANTSFKPTQSYEWDLADKIEKELSIERLP